MYTAYSAMYYMSTPPARRAGVGVGKRVGVGVVGLHQGSIITFLMVRLLQVAQRTLLIRPTTRTNSSTK